jgi:hypothetical protein
MYPEVGSGVMILVGLVAFMFVPNAVLKMLGAAMVIGASLGLAYISVFK